MMAIDDLVAAIATFAKREGRFSAAAGGGSNCVSLLPGSVSLNCVPFSAGCPIQSRSLRLSGYRIKLYGFREIPAVKFPRVLLGLENPRRIPLTRKERE